jgi:predicted nucleotide-binding protein
MQASRSKSSARLHGKKVFVVHGHSEDALREVELFLRSVDVEPIILRQLPNQGRTLIEKFETYADEVGFAVVLLTADDQGGARMAAPDGAAGSALFEPKAPIPRRDRARQNVILELGFFLGRLGRDRVCAIHESGVEIPSDYTGVLFVPFTGRWKQELARELAAAGIPYDHEKALAVL